MTTVELRKGGVTLIGSVGLSQGFCERSRGLLGRRSLGAGRALWLKPCRGIHTFFMRFPLDVVFLDSGQRVVRVVRNVPPWRVVFGGRRARSVLEMEAGWFPEHGLGTRDEVELRPRATGTGVDPSAGAGR